MVLQISVDTGGVTFLQMAIAAWLLLLAVGVLLAGRYKMAFVGLSGEQARQKRHLQGQRQSQTPRSLRIDPADDVSAYRESVRQLFVRDGVAGGRLDEDPTLRDALGVAVGEFRSAWGRRTASIPRLARSLVELGVVITVLGGLTTLSAETIRRLVTTDGSISLSYIIETAANVINEFAVTAVDVLGSFPFVGLLWSLTFAHAVLFGQLLYEHPFAVAAGLGLLAVVVLALDRRVPKAADRTIAPRRAQATLVAIAAFVTVWAAGAVVATGLSFLSVIGPRTAAAVGLLVAGIVALVWVVISLRWLRGRIRTLAGTIDGASTAGAAYLLVRRIAVVYGSIASLLVPAYVVALVASGRLAAQVNALLAASLPVKVGVGVVGVAVLAGVALVVRDAAADLRTAVLNLSARSAVRARLVGRGVPIITFVVAYFLLVGFELGAVLAAGGAVVAAVATYGIVVVVLRAKHFATVYEPPERRPLSLVIVGYVLTTADGRCLYVARVNTTWLALDDADALTDEVIRAAGQLAAGRDVPPSVPRQHATDAFEYGIVDVDETRERIKQSVRTEAKGRLRKQNGMMEADALRAKLESYPDRFVERVLTELRLRGELRREEDHIVLV